MQGEVGRVDGRVEGFELIYTRQRDVTSPIFD